MRLHQNWDLFTDALQAASQPIKDGGLGIKSIFIEKDYWICRSLALMAANDKESCYIQRRNQFDKSLWHRRQILRGYGHRHFGGVDS